MAITAAQVKELRELTGAGMMDCKKALTECEGDTKKAIDWLREKGIAKAAKKEGRIAAEGLAKILIEGNKAVVLEVNSETDFVAKNDRFLALLDEAAKTIFNSNAKTVEEALALPTAEGTLNDSFIGAVAVIGEKITLRRFEIVEKSDDELFGSYTHQGGRIVAVTVVKGTADAQVAKNMAMQVASMNPKFVDEDGVDPEYIENEKKILTEQVLNEGKKPEMVEKIVAGKIKKELKEVCLVDQPFVKDSDLSVGQYVEKCAKEIGKDMKVVSMVRFEVGEGIEKKEDDFAAEVAAAVQG